MGYDRTCKQTEKQITTLYISFKDICKGFQRISFLLKGSVREKIGLRQKLFDCDCY